MPRALISGTTGQDGTYLAELLLAKGYQVFGIVRGQANPRRTLVPPGVRIIDADLADLSSLIRAYEQAQPDEVYNLGAISHVGYSFTNPLLTADITGSGAVRMLEALRIVAPEARFFQASTSEMFGNEPGPQNEQTPFRPRSPYGAAKAYAHHMAVNYREAYGLHVSCGICFNHESPRRGLEFVTRKIAHGLTQIKHGRKERLHLGNLSASRDWGYAGDYVEAMRRMLQQDTPGDYVIATGESHTVGDLLDHAAERLHLDWWDVVDIDQSLVRPAEVNYLLGDATKARETLGWEPKVTFPQLVSMMVDAELAAVRTDPNLSVRNRHAYAT